MKTSFKGIGARQRRVLVLMSVRGGYPGVSPYDPEAPWPYLNVTELHPVLETLIARGLVRPVGDGRCELTEACRRLMTF